VENIFYVYEHWRPDTNTCFYVGKGKGNRAWDMKNMRNRHFMAVISKLISMGLMVDVRLIAKNLLEEDAFSMEVEKIAFYGIDNLTNMTSGGDGLKNPSKETREKISKSQKERFARPEEKEKASLRSKNRITSKETKKKISLLGIGRKHSPETLEKMKIAAKIRGISEKTRKAQKLSVTGKKRAPFSEETRAKMSISSKLREAKHRELRNAT
jgi:hypothetical protein